LDLENKFCQLHWPNKIANVEKMLSFVFYSEFAFQQKIKRYVPAIIRS